VDLAQRTDRWRRWRLDPLPMESPPYRLLGIGQPRIFVAQLDRRYKHDIQDLDARWFVDVSHTRTSTSERDDIARGDAIIWVATQKRRKGNVHTIWPPGLVVAVSASGSQTHVTSIMDRWLPPISLSSVSISSHTGLLRAAERAVDAHLVQGRTDLLEPWGVHVWCDACGCMGSRTLSGLVGPEVATSRNESGQLKEWPTGVYELSGCTDFYDDSYCCPRCGYRWGGPPLVEADWWPEGRPTRDGEPLCLTVTELMAAVGASNVKELTEQIEEQAEPFDVEINEVSAMHLSGFIGSMVGFSVSLPATVDDLWADVHDSAGWVRCYGEMYAFSEVVTSVEGFPIGWGVSGYPNGSSWPDFGVPELAPYPFDEQAPGEWTIGRWLEERIGPWRELHDMGQVVTIADRSGTPLDYSTLLSGVRQLAGANNLWDSRLY
jgi:hypothetical protein